MSEGVRLNKIWGEVSRWTKDPEHPERLKLEPAVAVRQYLAQKARSPRPSPTAAPGGPGTC